MTGLRTGYFFSLEYFLHGQGVQPDLVVFGKMFRFSGILAVNPKPESLVSLDLLQYFNGRVTESVSSSVLYASQCMLDYLYREQKLQKWRQFDDSIRTTLTEVFLQMSGLLTREQDRHPLSVRGMGAIWFVSRGSRPSSRILLDILAQPTLEDLRRNIPNGDFQ